MNCPDCGRDLEKIPEQYRDFVHSIPGKSDWCLPPEKFSPEAEAALDKQAEALTKQFRKTLEEVLNGNMVISLG
jgi:hypothetical protein